MVKIVISEDLYEEIKQFAELCVQTNIDMYSKRNQRNPSRILQQIIQGKVAEWGVWEYLGSDPDNEPDMRILEPHEKSYEPDLLWGDFRVHVKSICPRSAELYGVSWIMSSSDPLLNGKSTDKDHLIGTIVDEREVELVLSAPFNQLIINVPKKKEQRASKKAIYFKMNKRFKL